MKMRTVIEILVASAILSGIVVSCLEIPRILGIWSSAWLG